MDILIMLQEGIKEVSLTEGLAVLFGLTYLILIARKNRMGWWFALVSSCLYVYLSFSVKLYLESFLQTFYVFMAFYGWISWNRAKKDTDFLQRWKIKNHFFFIIGGSVMAVLLGYLMMKVSDQNYPYLNAFTTVFSLLATFMAAHRVVENWIYWIIIDSILIFLYTSQGLLLVGLNYLIYTIIAIFAWISWNKTFKTKES